MMRNVKKVRTFLESLVAKPAKPNPRACRIQLKIASAVQEIQVDSLPLRRQPPARCGFRLCDPLLDEQLLGQASAKCLRTLRKSRLSRCEVRHS